MNKKLFVSYLQNYLIPSIQQIVAKLLEVKKIVVQFDQAGGHGGGRSDMKQLLDELNNLGRAFPKPILFITQCSRYGIMVTMMKLI